MTLNTDVKRLWAWLTRTGAGRRFPGTPIGWYQCHQAHCESELARKIRHAIGSTCASDGLNIELRCRARTYQARLRDASGKRRWFDLCSVDELFMAADNRSRGY